MGDESGNHRGGSSRPQHITVRALDSAALVAWERPAGGDRVTSYDLTPCLHSSPLAPRTVSVDGSATSALVRGLSNGETYTIRVTPWLDQAPGPSALSPSFQPNPPPGAPTAVAATPGEQSATVTWTPATAGGPVDEYRITASPADVGVTVVPATQAGALVSGLRNRVRYTFTVTAINGAGETVSNPSNAAWPGDDLPRYVFPLAMIYLLGLLLLAFLYAVNSGITVPVPLLGDVAIPSLRAVIPPRVAAVPVSVFWFGAAGAVLNGLYGIFDHGHRDWQRRLDPWHIARPFTGALLGSVAYIAFIGVIRATGATPVTNDPIGRLPYFVVAFLVGFREQAFRLLIQRVADLLLGPGIAQTIEK